MKYLTLALASLAATPALAHHEHVVEAGSMTGVAMGVGVIALAATLAVWRRV